MARVGARKTDPLHAVNLVDRFEEAGEIAARLVGRIVVIHDLAEQLHLAMSCARRLAHFGQDVGPCPHPLVAAGVGDDAEATEFVAAFDDRDVRLH